MADSDFVTESQLNALSSAISTAVNDHADHMARYVFHGSVASTARPTNAGVVVWVGTVAPTNANTATDFWIDTT